MFLIAKTGNSSQSKSELIWHSNMKIAHVSSIFICVSTVLSLSKYGHRDLKQSQFSTYNMCHPKFIILIQITASLRYHGNICPYLMKCQNKLHNKCFYFYINICFVTFTCLFPKLSHFCNDDNYVFFTCFPCWVHSAFLVDHQVVFRDLELCYRNVYTCS